MQTSLYGGVFSLLIISTLVGKRYPLLRTRVYTMDQTKHRGLWDSSASKASESATFLLLVPAPAGGFLELGQQGEGNTLHLLLRQVNQELPWRNWHAEYGAWRLICELARWQISVQKILDILSK
jgi:hypothetical protein